MNKLSEILSILTDEETINRAGRNCLGLIADATGYVATGVAVNVAGQPLNESAKFGAQVSRHAHAGLTRLANIGSTDIDELVDDINKRGW